MTTATSRTFATGFVALAALAIGVLGVSAAQGAFDSEVRADLKAAILNDDYEAWAEASANHPKGDAFVDEETFNVLVDAHALLEAGDKEGARTLFEASGIRPPHARIRALLHARTDGGEPDHERMIEHCRQILARVDAQASVQ